MSRDEMQSLTRDLFARRISRRTFSTRAIAAGFSASAVSAFLAACGGGESSGNPADSSGQITVWTWPDNDKTFEKTIPIFEKKFPKITVKVQAFDSNSYHDKLLAALVSGSGPDVAMVEIGNIAKFKGKPGFVDLAQSPYDAKQYKSNYAAYSWNYVADEQTGKIFTLPKNTGPGAMFYRRDLFQKAGLPTEPDAVHALLKDWDAFLAAAKKLTVSGKQWMVATPGQIFDTMRAQAHLSYYDASGNLQLRNPAYRTALQYTKDAWKAGFISPFKEWGTEWAATMQNGTIATYLYGNWFGGLLKSVYAKGTDGKWGVTDAPAFQGNSAYDSGGDFIGILESSQNKGAAWNFIKFVTQDPDSLKTMYLANDLYPAWSPALSQQWLNTSDTFYSGQQVNQIFSQVQAKMTPPVTNPNDPVVSTVMTSALQDLTQGNLSVDAVLDKAEQQIKAKTGK
jgi:ABC-type glycerol-3-phosphate transport system substrate-binding protein